MADQTRFLAALANAARENPSDRDLLVRIRDEVFTIRETLDTLEVPHALVANEDWDRVPRMVDREGWPRAVEDSA